MQGGGARGAWQAGVLEGLLEKGELNDPVAMWGTSAGAINALWAATASENATYGHLLELWIKFARRILVGGTLGILFCGALLFWCAISHGTVLILAVVVISAALTIIAKKQPFGIERLPGILSVQFTSRILPFNNLPARWYAYFVAADVSLRTSPVSWNWDTLACFEMKPGSDSASLTLPAKRADVDPRLAVMCSAALPIMTRPLAVGVHRLLDGGLEANLPAGHLSSQGMSGGNCAICIIPGLLSSLEPSDHVDFRTLKFLHEMKNAQSTSRSNIQSADFSVHAAHTLRPIVLIQPDAELKSGLIQGFLCTSILRKEFEQGFRQGQSLRAALRQFQLGVDEALSAHLLEGCALPSINAVPPKMSFWGSWVNSRWE
jgi:predicted acylesterase/phospholipase RssA